MKATVERLSGELSARYLIYIERLMVDIWSENGEIELRCGFSLRLDHRLRTVTFKISATIAGNDANREVAIATVFKQFELLIDQDIAEASPN